MCQLLQSSGARMLALRIQHHQQRERVMVTGHWPMKVASLGFADHTVVSCLASLQSRLSVRSAPRACRFASLSLLCLHARSAATPMQRCIALLHSSGGTGSPCLFCAPQHVSSRNAFTRCLSERCSPPLATAETSRRRTASSHSGL